MNIDDYYLHDALLKEIKCRWKERTVSFYLDAFLNGIEESAEPCILSFYEVQDLLIPHHNAWGDSVHINCASEFNKGYKIEMQSGDCICINASSFHIDQ